MTMELTLWAEVDNLVVDLRMFRNSQKVLQEGNPLYNPHRYSYNTSYKSSLTKIITHGIEKQRKYWLSVLIKIKAEHVVVANY